jgi:hypothetical protein
MSGEKSRPEEQERKRHQDELLDEMGEETFPASDPPANMARRGTRKAEQKPEAGKTGQKQ